ncbi:MAG TPA: hypothetical protein VFH45_04275 [Acidimicrobiales bacterium]|nr:hypothetical protein [Acidimicrobiales bacterium]
MSDVVTGPGPATTSAAATATRRSAGGVVGRSRWTGDTTAGVLSAVVLALPFAVIIGRYLADGSAVHLSDDLALGDLHVREAMGLHQLLGPFDRFGWNHPGPVYYYLQSFVAHLVGPGARADYVGAAVINLAAAGATVWAVRRRSGPLAGLWTSACLAFLAIMLTSTSLGLATYSEGAIGAVVNPWNPDVVIFPLVLTGVLAAAGAAGRGAALLGAALTGSFAVQTNLATAPLVATFLVASAGAAAVGWWRAGRPLRRPGLLVTAGLVALVAVWAAPLVQELTGHPGNLTLIWRFFRAPHRTLSLAIGLWSTVSATGVLMFGIRNQFTTLDVLGDPRPYAWLVLLVVLVGGAATLAIGVRRRDRFAAALGAAGLLGFGAVVVSVTRIVGPVFGYLVLWEVAVPIVGLIGLGVAVIGRARCAGRALWALSGVAVLSGCVLGAKMAALPPLTAATDPASATAWTLVEAHLPARRGPVFVGDTGTDFIGLFTFFGVVDDLEAHGYQPRVSPFWRTEVGDRHVTRGGEPVRVLLLPPSAANRALPGYAGHTAHADVTVTVDPGYGGPGAGAPA